MSPHIPADVWMKWVQMEFAKPNYRVLTVRRTEIQCPTVPPERRHISFELRDCCCAALPGSAVTSHLMPTFARVHLAFERGEGVWLIATDGERYLDFTSGVAVNALGHAHPHLVAALAEQSAKLWHVSNLFEIPESERAAAAAVRRKLRRRGILLQFRRRGCRGRDQDAPANIRRRTARRNATASSLSKALSTAARWRRSPPAARRNISKASARRSKASIRFHSAISRPSKAPSATKPPPS